MAVFDEAEPGAEYAITRYRRQNSNLRTELLRIIQRAGLKPWPRLFQNLRSTRETELCETYPVHVVTAWIGNTVPVAEANYLQMRDEYFDQATHVPAKAVEAAQKAVRQPVALVRKPPVRPNR